MNGSLIVTNTRFFSNTSQYTGGGLRVNGLVTLNGAEFELNRAYNDGGGLFVDNTAVISGSQFINNTAQNVGGGAYIFNSGDPTAVLTNTQFISNTALTSTGGGLQVFSGVIISKGLFQDNRCVIAGCNGGGLYGRNAVNLSGTQFISNTAVSQGGGLFHLAGNGQIVNTLFVRNQASNGTAMRLNSTGIITIQHTTIASPTLATNSAIFINAGTVNITNTIIANHATGIQRGNGTVTQNFNLFFGNTTNITGTVGGGANSRTGDPAFANPVGDDYHLTATSAAIDAGQNVGVISDFEDESRPQGGTFDIGYDESPFTSAPEMAIMGNGFEIVDGDTSPATADHTDFGSVIIGQALTRTFTISNSGNANLTLTGSPLISITGAAAGDFTVATNPTTPIVSGSSVTFQVRFDPTATGARNATLSIANDDTDENPYNFAIQGTGVAANQAPIADAGSDQSVNTSALVSLDGTGSTDPDGNTPITFGWTQTGGLAVTLSSSTTSQPSFTAPADPATLTFSLTVTDSLGLADSTPDTIVVTVNNQTPIANAGADQNADTSALVSLDGTGSTDPDGDTPLSFGWTQTGGPAVILSSSTASQPSFTTPDDPATLTFSLTITDSLGLANSTTDTIVVTVNNQAPIADAGADQSVNTNALVSLDGTGSTDPDGDTPLTFGWTQTGGPAVTLSSSTASQPSFTAPADPATLTFSLAVTDSLGLADSTPDTIVVTINNQAPIADAGADQGVNTSALVSLDGTGSTDPDGDTPLTYGWTQTGGPAVTLSSSTTSQPSFTAPADPATLTFSLAVTDSLGLADSTPDTIVVTVNNQAPIADAGSDQSVNTVAIVALTGSGSSDPDGDTPLNFGWTQIGGPAVTLSDTSASSPTFFAPGDPATLTFSLTVTDSLGLADSSPDTIVVTVNNQVPVANAGADQSVNPNVLVTLNGSGSFDPDNDLPLTFGWTQSGGPAVSLSSLSAVSPTFTAPASPAVLTFTLSVTDSLSLADATPEPVVVTVGDAAITGLNAANSSPTLLGSSTNFTATISGGSNVSYAWNFGNGQSGSGATPNHTYAAAGSYTAIVTASNSLGSVSATTLVTITSPNAVPSFTSSPVTTATVNQAYTYNIATSDPNAGDTWVISAPTKPAWLTLTDNGNGSATLSGTPNSGQLGSHTVSLLVTDSGNLTAAQNFNITVNPAVQVNCSGSSLNTLLNSAGPIINLDGNCRYLVTQAFGGTGLFDLNNKNNLTINGNGATIERDNSAPNRVIFSLSQSNNLTFKNVTLKGGKGTWGGGMDVYQSSVTLNGVSFIGNQATYGGGVEVYNGSATIVNSVFANNQATDAGAAIWAYGNVTIENSTLIDNFNNPKEAIFAWKTLTVQNSIIVNHNTAIAAAGGASNPVSEDYNIFSDNNQIKKIYNTGTAINSGGHSLTVENLSQHFVDPASFNYRLKASSPAVDKGTLLNTSTDADSNTRPFSGTQVDAGAYEFQGSGGPSLTILKSGPAWVQANTTFVYKVIIANNGLATATNLRITDTLPAGASFVGNASDGGTFSGGAVTWNISSLAVGQVKTVQYEAQISQNVTNVNYQVASTSDSSISAVGKPVETRVNNSLVASLGFFPKPDGFGFPNWGKPANDTDLTAKNIYAVYGPNVCTSGTGGSANTCVLNAAGEGFRQNWLKSSEGGHCYGMAVGSLKLFLNEPFIDGRTTPAQFQAGAATTFDLTRNADMQNLISHYFFNQAAQAPINPQGKTRLVTNGTPNSVVNFLTTHSFDGPANDDTYALGFRKRDGSGGHAVTPYALENKGGGIYWLYVYDNNYPNNFERVVKINTSANTWVYEGAAINPSAPASTYEGDASTGTINLHSVDYATNYPKKCSFCTPVSATSQLNTLAADEVIEFSLAGEGRLRVTNSAGQHTGYDSGAGQLVNQIPGGEMDTMFNGLELNIPPLVRVPVSGTYSLQVMNTNNALGNPEAEADLHITSPGLVISFKGLKIDSAEPGQNSSTNPFETMGIGFDYANKKISFQASSNDTDTPTLSMAVNLANGKSYQFELSGMQLATGKTVEMSFDPATEKLSFSDNDSGQAQTYNLSATRILTDGTKNTYQQNNITGGSGDGVEVNFGTWDGVNDPVIEPIANNSNTNIYLPIIRNDVK